MDYIDGFLYIEPSLNPWDEAYLMMVNGHFHMVLDLFGKYFIEYLLNIFASMFIREIVLKFSFFVWSLGDLGISLIVVLCNELGLDSN